MRGALRQLSVLRVGRLSVSRLSGPLGLLFLIDLLTNVADYTFHLFLGRALTPGDFAIVQTINTSLLIVVTTFGVMQPVVARFTAEAEAQGQAEARQRAIFQLFFGQSLALGLALTLLVWLGRQPLARWLNVPEAAVSLSALMVMLALVRPVVAGLLQGRQQFAWYGLTRTAFAIARLALAVLFVGFLGGRALAGVATIPLAALLSLMMGLAFVGGSIWQHGQAPTMGASTRPRYAPGVPRMRHLAVEGWRLSLAALLAYAAYMSLQSIDLLWVNRSLPPRLAGSYAAAVVLRRVLALLPGAVIVIFFPRVVTIVTRKGLPDRLLAKTATIIAGTTVVLTAGYFAFGRPLVALTFGASYADAASLLGWMGLAMVGYGLASIWLNLFLATRPWVFVVLLLGTLALEIALLVALPATLEWITAIFVLSGWLLAVGGLVVYVHWLRPGFVRAG